MQRRELKVSIEERVRRVFETTLDIEIAPGADVLREEEARWDSLKHVALIFALEDEFGIEFDEAQMAGLDSLSRAVEALDAA